MAALIGWFLSLHGSIGLVETARPVLYLVILLGIIGAAGTLTALVILIIREGRRAKNRKTLHKALTVVVWVVVAVGILIPVSTFAVLKTLPVIREKNKPPQLLVANGHGEHGIPNMAVTFWTEKETKNTLHWGEGNTDRTISESEPSREHAIMLKDLTPDTRYLYQINDGKEYSFMSPPSASMPLKFAVSSDSHIGADSARKDETLQILETVTNPANGFRLLFLLGDFVEFGFDDDMWNEALDTFSPYTTEIPTRPLPGNHDTLVGGVGLYESYMSPKGMELNGGSRLWGRIDVNDIHFFLLDLEWGTQSYSDEQRAWLEEQLAETPEDDWKIVMSHCFYYSSGTRTAGWNWYDDRDMIDTFEPLFEKYGVDLVVAGHNHTMELLEANDITYCIIGAFGGKPDPERAYTSPASVWFKSHQYGFLDVSISDDRAEIIFRDPDYGVLESAEVIKGQGLVSNIKDVGRVLIESSFSNQ